MVLAVELPQGHLHCVQDELGLLGSGGGPADDAPGEGALGQQREQTRHERLGGERRRRRGAGAKDKLSDADLILATVLCLRKIGTHTCSPGSLASPEALSHEPSRKHTRSWPSTITPSTRQSPDSALRPTWPPASTSTEPIRR